MSENRPYDAVGNKKEITSGGMTFLISQSALSYRPHDKTEIPKFVCTMSPETHCSVRKDAFIIG